MLENFREQFEHEKVGKILSELPKKVEKTSQNYAKNIEI